MEEKKHFLFKHPFTAIVAGPTGSGKTEFVRKLLNYHKLLITKEGQLRVLWCYGQKEAVKINLNINSVSIAVFEGIPTEADIKSLIPDLLIIDDLMNESGKSKELVNLFTKGSHH